MRHRGRDLHAEIDDVAGRLAVLVAVGVGLGVGAVADPEGAGLAHPVERGGLGHGAKTAAASVPAVRMAESARQPLIGQS